MIRTIQYSLLFVVFILLTACQGSRTFEPQVVEEVQSAQRYAYRDPVRVSPEMYGTLLEKSTFRILKIEQKPGEQDRWHSHPDAAIYLLSTSEVLLYTPDGDPQIIKSETGDSYFEPATNMHSMKNIGESDYVGILCELKTKLSENAHLDNVYTTPTDLISLKVNNDRMHVLELTLRPGDTEQLSANSKKVFYYITDASVNLVSESGASDHSDRPQGTSSYHSLGAIQSIENLGTETVRAVIFEIR